jgi:hypothetical protein
MPLIRLKRPCLVARCPVCGDSPNLGCDAIPHLDKRDDVHDWLQDTDGDTVDEKIANSCSPDCGTVYHHRRCEAGRLCGYCREKGVAWLADLRKKIAERRAKEARP